jgi:hypothetical protein
VAPLVKLIALLPQLSAVLLQGGDAIDTWRRLRGNHPDILTGRRIEVAETYPRPASPMVTRPARARTAALKDLQGLVLFTLFG